MVETQTKNLSCGKRPGDFLKNNISITYVDSLKI
jgi:hypothetical protein